MKRLHAFVSGRVQGVFFRSETSDLASNLNLKGWVRNLRDGRVEVVAEGEDDKLEELVKFLHKGPPHAIVADVWITWEKFKNEFQVFDVVY